MTGATGNLGTALLASRAAEFVPVGRADWSRLPELMESGVDAVLHTAWDLTSRVTQDPAAVLDANVMTTMRLLEACRTNRIPKFAFVSTCAVYGEGMNTAEDAACCPVTINGVTKLLDERIIEAFCAEAGIDCQIYRVFNMYGGTDRFSVLSHIRKALDAGTPFVLNNGGIAQRDFIHVDDVAGIVMRLLPMDLPHVHMNVGTGRSTRISDIAAAVQRLQPALTIVHSSVREAEYSRADIARLSATLDGLRFRDVMAFVESSFSD